MLNRLIHIHRQIDYSAVLALLFVVWGVLAATQIIIEGFTIKQQEHDKLQALLYNSILE
jgi:hypothetical protein